jgi:serine/arginine repetitive matrix protein 1
MASVKRSFIDGWISRRVSEILGFEDEVVIGLIVNTLDGEVRGASSLVGIQAQRACLLFGDIIAPRVRVVCRLQKPDPREMVLNLTGFLEKESLPFVSELWKLLVSAQSSADGIPMEFKQAKLAQMASAPVSYTASMVVLYSFVLACPRTPPNACS